MSEPVTVSFRLWAKHPTGNMKALSRPAFKEMQLNDALLVPAGQLSLFPNNCTGMMRTAFIRSLPQRPQGLAG